MVRQVLLLIEDNPYDQVLTLRAFHKSSAASVVVARDGFEALRYLLGEEGTPAAAELPTLVVLDLKLPRMDGFEVLRRLRAHRRTHLLPVVILSSSLEEGDLERCYALGANSYLRKPVDFVEFVSVASSLGSYWLGLNQPPPPARLENQS
jgi:two-component system response regulator